jgi:hypothetical protein
MKSNVTTQPLLPQMPEPSAGTRPNDSCPTALMPVAAASAPSVFASITQFCRSVTTIGMLFAKQLTVSKQVPLPLPFPPPFTWPGV